MKQKTGLMLFSVALGTFMAALDASVVNVANPVVQAHFDVPLATVEWVVTAYLIVVSSILLFFGRLSDLYGQKKLYITGFAVFTIGSAMCGLSASIGMLIGMRVVQALGAAMMFSTNSAIITHHVPADRRGRAFSVNAVSVAVALSAGPVLGGWLTSAFGWQSIYYINIPIGIIGIVIAMRFIPTDKHKPAVSMDVPGSVMIFAALFMILLALDRLSANIDTLTFVLLMLGGLFVAAMFIRFEKRSKHPILNLQLFRIRVFSASLSAAVFNYMAQYIMVFLVPFYLQTVRMYTPAMSGLLYMPMPLAALVTAPIAGAIADRADTRFLSSAGMGIMAVGVFLLSRLEADTPNSYIVMAMAVTGFGSGLFQTPNNSAVMSSVPSGSRGVASGMLATARNVGMVIGVGLSSALFTLFAGQAPGLAAEGMAGLIAQKASFIYALRLTFIVASVVAIAAMAASLTKGKVSLPDILKKAE